MITRKTKNLNLAFFTWLPPHRTAGMHQALLFPWLNHCGQNLTALTQKDSIDYFKIWNQKLKWLVTCLCLFHLWFKVQHWYSAWNEKCEYCAPKHQLPPVHWVRLAAVSSVMTQRCMMPQATNLTQFLWPLAALAVESGDASSWNPRQVNESFPLYKSYPSLLKALMLEAQTSLPWNLGN